jgi:hypothetical protein
MLPNLHLYATLQQPARYPRTALQKKIAILSKAALVAHLTGLKPALHCTNTAQACIHPAQVCAHIAQACTYPA